MSDDDEMPVTQFTFLVGMALGKALAPAVTTPTVPRLEPGQRYIQMWSEPDWLGYRQLLTFELKDSDRA